MLSLEGDYAICACTRVPMSEPVLVVWEYLIAFTNGIDIFWRRPKTATSLLFVVIRWTVVTSAMKVGDGQKCWFH